MKVQRGHGHGTGVEMEIEMEMKIQRGTEIQGLVAFYCACDVPFVLILKSLLVTFSTPVR